MRINAKCKFKRLLNHLFEPRSHPSGGDESARLPRPPGSLRGGGRAGREGVEPLHSFCKTRFLPLCLPAGLRGAHTRNQPLACAVIDGCREWKFALARVFASS